MKGDKPLHSMGNSDFLLFTTAERMFALTMLSRLQSAHLKAVEQRDAKQAI